MKHTDYQTGQNTITGVVVGIVVSTMLVIGIISIVVAAILYQQRCGRKWDKKQKNGFGIRKLLSSTVYTSTTC